MKKILFFLLSMLIMFACSEDKEIPSVEPPIVNPDSNEKPKPVEGDSIYYQLDVDGFELVAASEDSTCLFLKADTTFAFSCLFDSCGTNRLVAYCDSTGIVERIVIDEQVINVFHHEDKKKMDIFYKDTEGKIAWIKDVESPYKNLSSRAESGNVPYSAISVVSDISYAVYNIINISDIYKVTQPEKYTFINKLSKKEAYKMNASIALKLIMQILGQEYKVSASQHLSTVIRAMSDYANWVQQELYGDAIPALRSYAYAAGNSMSVAAYVTEVDSLKTEFKVGIMVAEDGDKLNPHHFLEKKDVGYNSKYINYPFSFSGLETGKKYKFRSYLLPISTSKYMKGLKGLLDYYRMNSSVDYRLLETKAQLISTGDNHATIKLSVENVDISIKMGVIYSEHSDLLEHEYKKIEYEPTFGEGLFSNNFEKEIKLENLKPDSTYYYMPYIIYDDDVLNRNIYPEDSIFTTAVLTEKDQTFYGKKESFTLGRNSLRDILKRIYNECNGKSWKHQKNWMTDLPVTEWEGVERTERKGRSADYLYHFKFMAMNNLTGTLTIENCSENIVLYNCDYANNKLEGLHLKNCPNLYFDNKIYQNGEDITPYWVETGHNICFIGTISNHLTSICIDNINSTIIDRDVEAYYKTRAICSNFEGLPNKWENLEIRNCTLYGIEISNCSSLKTIICESNEFEDNMVDEITISNCSSLGEIIFRNNNTLLSSIFYSIIKCHNLKNVLIEGNGKIEGNSNDIRHKLDAYDSQINELKIINGSHFLTYLKRFYYDSEQLLTIKNIYVSTKENPEFEHTSFHFELDNVDLNKIGLENLIVEGNSSIRGLDFSNNPTIKSIEFIRGKSGSPYYYDDLILNGCINLERFYSDAHSTGHLDVRNTPKLKELTCRGSVGRIEFDSHMNDVDIDCLGLSILQPMPDCYTGEGSGWFSHDARYEYVYKDVWNESIKWWDKVYVETIDHERGWWYPHEPDSRQHSR